MDIDKLLEEARGFLDLKMWQEAQEVVDRLPDAAQSLPQVLGLRVSICWEGKQFELMAKAAQEMVDLNPERSTAWLNLASAKRHAFGMHAGKTVLEEATLKCPADADVLFSLACYESEMGEAQKAKAFLDASITLNPDLKMHALEASELSAMWAALSKG